MSLIDDDAAAAAVPGAMGALFGQLLMPLAEDMRAGGALPFPLAPDASCPSYYVRRRCSSMAPADFGSASCADPDELALRLAAHWESLGRDQLALLAGRFGMAARMAQGQQARVALAPEISPYVYAMF